MKILGPGLKSDQLRTPRTYAQASDLRKLRGLLQKFRGELRQWSKDDELTPAASALLAIHNVIAGVGGGKDGLGLQLSPEDWAEILGCTPRHVSRAFGELQAEDFVSRYTPQASLASITDGARKTWRDRTGGEHRDVNLVGVSYLTGNNANPGWGCAGARRIEGRGEISEVILTPKGRKRVRRQGGLVGFLLSALAVPLRRLARRVAPVRTQVTPKEEAKPSRTRSPLGNRSRPSRESRPAGAPSSEIVRARSALVDALEQTVRQCQGAQGGGRSGVGARTWLRGELEEATNCFVDGVRSADAWRPDAWRRASDSERTRLAREFARLVPLLQVLAELEPGRAGAARAGPQHEPGGHWWTGPGDRPAEPTLAQIRAFEARQAYWARELRTRA